MLAVALLVLSVSVVVWVRNDNSTETSTHVRAPNQHHARNAALVRWTRHMRHLQRLWTATPAPMKLLVWSGVLPIAHWLAQRSSRCCCDSVICGRGGEQLQNPQGPPCTASRTPIPARSGSTAHRPRARGRQGTAPAPGQIDLGEAPCRRDALEPCDAQVVPERRRGYTAISHRRRPRFPVPPNTVGSHEELPGSIRQQSATSEGCPGRHATLCPIPSCRAPRAQEQL